MKIHSLVPALAALMVVSVGAAPARADDGVRYYVALGDSLAESQNGPAYAVMIRFTKGTTFPSDYLMMALRR